MELAHGVGIFHIASAVFTPWIYFIELLRFGDAPRLFYTLIRAVWWRGVKKKLILITRQSVKKSADKEVMSNI